MAENEIKLVIELHVYNHGSNKFMRYEKKHDQHDDCFDKGKKSIQKRIFSLCGKQGGELLSVLINKLKRKDFNESSVCKIIDQMEEDGLLQKTEIFSRGKNSIRYETC